MLNDKPSENTYILDAESATEMARLINQAQLITETMGSLFPKQTNPTHVHTVLDVACGPGSWVRDVAHAYRHLEVMGVDISSSMISYALAHTRAQGLDNASFEVMNVIQPMPFSDHSFDLINARFLVGFLPKVNWLPLLQECWRLLRPGGIIQLTEFDEPGVTNSLAFEEWKVLTFRAIAAAGLHASPDGRHFGIMAMLEYYLRKLGYQNIQQQAHVLNFSAGMAAYDTMYQNCMVAFAQVQPFLLKMKVVEQDEMEQRYQQLLQEMLDADFCGIWPFLTAWGSKPL